ncbi:MAG: hypothetical protein ACTSVU_03005 [Promethearchaeota archaeon]
MKRKTKFQMELNSPSSESLPLAFISPRLLYKLRDVREKTTNRIETVKHMILERK